MDGERLSREFQQIALIQNRINDLSSSGIPQSEQVKEIIDYITSTQNFVSDVVDNALSNNIALSENSLSILNHELKTPLVPIKTYTKMLFQEKFGPLNPEQKMRLDIVNKNIDQLEQKIRLFLDRNMFALNISDDHTTHHRINELEQEKLILGKINDLLIEKETTSELKMGKLKDDLTKSEHDKNEFAQKALVLDKTVREGEQKIRRLTKKNITIVVISALVVGTGFGAYSIYVVGLVGQQYQVSNLGTLPTGYVIQNLRGDTVNTWLSWRLVSGSTLHVGITNGLQHSEKIPLIMDVITSEESISVDDSLLHKGPKGTTSTYYLGWQGALNEAAKKSTEFYIPTKLEIVESAGGEGEITIILTDSASGDGNSGFTNSIADTEQNQILKSKITIYNVSDLSDDQFKTILRHEFGHALGLAHSTAPEDLMAPTIMTLYPYISECDVDSISKLYDGGKNSQVICDK